LITTYYVTDALAHDSGSVHPESAERVRALNSLFIAMEKEGLTRIHETSPAKDLSLFRLAHDPTYIDFLENPQKSLPVKIDPDTCLSPGSLSAMKGLSGAITTINKEITTSQRCFLLARPPGHHARRSTGMGFCLVNTIATQALSLLSENPELRIAIFDFDVHHGNGTEEILGKTAGVLTISTHQHPFYPGTGSGRENHIGPSGEGLLDIPLPEGTTDDAYLRVFESRVLPRLTEFAPDVLLVSAGFDGHQDDPLGGFLLTENIYRDIGKQLSSGFPSTFIVSILEGGYNLRALTNSVRSYMEGLNS
jgi:acetoin utilization deacetylase AcuC-like enzyme